MAPGLAWAYRSPGAWPEVFSDLVALSMASADDVLRNNVSKDPGMATPGAGGGGDGLHTTQKGTITTVGRWVGEWWGWSTLGRTATGWGERWRLSRMPGYV